jgi:hypothetical protein
MEMSVPIRYERRLPKGVRYHAIEEQSKGDASMSPIWQLHSSLTVNGQVRLNFWKGSTCLPHDLLRFLIPTRAWMTYRTSSRSSK